MMLDDDLKSILDDMVVWRKNYLNKCNEVRELTSQIDILKSELRISKDAEQRMLLQLNRKQENFNQLQEMLSKYSEEQDMNLKKIEENEQLKKELEKMAKIYKEERQNWEKEKSEIIEKHKKELIYIRETGNHEVYKLQTEIQRLNENNVNAIQSLKNEVVKKENEYKHTISKTISHYEAELSKLNGDLATAQSEIKQLRERCAANFNMYRNVNTMEVGTYVINPNESKPYCKFRFEPIPILTAHSQLYNETSESSTQPQLLQSDNNITEQESAKKPKLPIIRKTLITKSPTQKTTATNTKSTSPHRKKKLYFHHNDLL
ncbi:hypothetical protein O3M35_013353 [Rhynocoris fuscipes]|uniref:Uncharacterized protein n=1 Tax=Rhynocoris fuscipes TaxID=488301 RepID=A0AAW1CGF5_9HEMI